MAPNEREIYMRGLTNMLPPLRGVPDPPEILAYFSDVSGRPIITRAHFVARTCGRSGSSVDSGTRHDQLDDFEAGIKWRSPS